MRPELSIVIPAYQESKRIGGTLDALSKYLGKTNLGTVEVLVVVADSPDGTADIARSKSKLFNDFRVVDAGPKVGKGRDVRIGMLEARGKYRLFMDADLATPLVHLEDIKSFMQRDGSVAIAVREIAKTHTGFRRLISGFGNLLVRISILPSITDTQCGFKAFSAVATDEIFHRQTILGWGFDMELLAIARKLKYKIDIIPAPDWVDVPNGTIHDQIGAAAIQTLQDLILIIWRKLTGKYNERTFTYEPNHK